MKTAIIYVFSGTGNTMKACELYKKEFIENGVETLVCKIEKNAVIPDPLSFDFIGIAYPIHGFNAPEIVLRFAKTLPKTNKRKEYFIIKTSGEPLKINNISSLKLDSILRRKGYILKSEYHYVMPYNMIFRHTDDMAYKMISTLRGLVPIHVKEILKGESHRLSRVPFGNIIAWIMRIEQPAMKINGKFFKVDGNRCNKCGLCEKNCPEHNIRINNDGKFEFGKNCIMCTRCSFNCPKDAFGIGLLNGWKVNGKYSFIKPEQKEIDNHPRYCKKSYERYFKNAIEKIGDKTIDNNVQ